MTAHWEADDVRALAAGQDGLGRPLPAQAWMALRRLGWGTAPPEGVTANDRVVRMAQEQAGRILRSACWRDGLIRAVTASWPADPGRRTPEEWDYGRRCPAGSASRPPSSAPVMSLGSPQPRAGSRLT